MKFTWKLKDEQKRLEIFTPASKIIILIFLLILFSAQTINLRVRNLNNIRMCDQFPGADGGARILACIADLPSTGGIADARSIQGVQAISSNPFSGVSKNVTLLLGAANYTTSATLAIPVNINLIGAGRNTTTITAANGLTKTITDTNGSNQLLMGFTVIGNATSGATGIILGDGTLTSNIVVRDITVNNFTGTNGVGFQVKDIVISSIYDLYTSGNTNDILIQADNSFSGPTTIDFYNCDAETALAVGVKVKTGFHIRFHNCTYQTNVNEGFLVQPDAANTAIDIINDNPWLEGNWAGDASKFNMLFDGSAAGTTVRSITNGGFWHSSNVAKSIKFIGAGASGWVLNNPEVKNASATVFIDATSGGGTCVIPSNLTFSTVVSDTSSKCSQGFLDTTAWTTWTPTFASSAGNAAVTFASTGTPVILLSKFKIQGKSCVVELAFTSAALNGTAAGTPSFISATVPTGCVPTSTVNMDDTNLNNTGNYFSAKMQTQPTIFKFFNYTTGGGHFVNFGVGQAIDISLISGSFEIN